MWHSHAHEVRSGQLIAPGIPEVAEKEFMRKIAGTYGKTWHTWHTDQENDLPLGTPMLMMGFTQDGQADEALVTAKISASTPPALRIVRPAPISNIHPSTLMRMLGKRNRRPIGGRSEQGP